jgi:hypothetical protein
MQVKRPDGRWSDERGDCPCCEELPSEHALYHCKRCAHGAPKALGTQQERDYFSSRMDARAGASIMTGVPECVRRE